MVTGRFSTLSSSAMPGSLSTSIWELIGIEIRLGDQNLEWVRNLPWAWGIYHGVQSSNRQFWSLVPYMAHTQEPKERRPVAVHQQIRDVPSNRSTIRMVKKILAIFICNWSRKVTNLSSGHSEQRIDHEDRKNLQMKTVKDRSSYVTLLTLLARTHFIHHFDCNTSYLRKLWLMIHTRTGRHL